MKFKILITPTALLDIKTGIEYYNLKVAELGFKFADEVNYNVRQILMMPKAYSIRYKTVRGKLLKKFPYIILYAVKEKSQSIEIIRIFNTYQNQYWKK